MDMKTRRFFYFGKFAVLGLLGIVTFTFVVMWLWNGLVPELFNGPVVTYWQTLGLLLLSKILFSGIGKGHRECSTGHSHDHPWKNKDKWRKKFEEKMNGKVEDKNDEGEVTVTE